MFAEAVIRMLNKHGSDSKYTVVTTGVYDPDTLKVSNTEVSHEVKIYMKHFSANQFNKPNLIGKDTAMFYLSASFGISPKPQDKIEFNSKTYKVDSVQSHAANGGIILYRIIGVV